ncbi:interleukin-13 receptor subunit alpha-1 [Chanodichthys erythropterus]|uniref:interleukin-13 receptor subunit alpha-1 n=1 Tax=Chanodichthys erythropterus TaxID=933992 RepID=UPI00351E83EC
MCRFWDLTLMICFSVSVMFVGGDNMAELPPPKNLTFIWETPFRLSLTWEKPEDLDHSCRVNYTVLVYNSQNCSEKKESKRVQTQGCKFEISNENGLCISVITNPENCEQRVNSQATNISIAPPSVRLVKNRSNEYSHSKMKCTWVPVVDVQDLSLYYWLPRDESIKECKPDETMKTRGCIIHDEFLKEAMNIFYLFKGTYNGTSIINTFKDERPVDYVKLNKPQLTIHRDGQKLFFQANGSDLDEFTKECYMYNYTISKCNKNETTQLKKSQHDVQYDPACKYRARVQLIFSSNCGNGRSDPSDEVEYGADNDPKLPALLAVIIIPLIVSFCLLVSLVLLRRHKDIIFPKIPEPSLLFKDMLINNIRTPEELQSPAAGRLYIPLEEVVESKISLEPDTPFVPTMKNEAK